MYILNFWVTFKANDQPKWVKKEDVIWYEHVRETGTGAGAMTCTNNHQKYRRYREELDGAVDESKGHGEH